jgi:chromosome partitioning protein
MGKAMMRTIVVYSPKGGTGKTTVARHLAVAAAMAGKSVATLDTDPQGTLTSWWGRRPSTVAAIQHFRVLLKEIDSPPEPIEGVDLLIIDTPTAVEAFAKQTEYLLSIADLVLTPTTATGEDVESVTSAMRHIQSHRRPAAFVLNRVKPRVKESTAARRALAGKGDVVPVDLPDRAEVYRTYPLGLAVQEMARGDCADDFDALWAYVAAKLWSAE